MSPGTVEPRLPIHLSLDDPEPLYGQIEGQLRDFILSGQLPPGTTLPSVRGLAKDLACSVITTRRAYQNLERAGLIHTRQGMGTLVAQLADEAMSHHRREPVEAALREALTVGRRTGFTDEELRQVFEDILHGHHDTIHEGND